MSRTNTPARTASRAATLLAAAILAVLPAMPAHADSLIDNVEGWTVDDNGMPRSFNGLVVGDDGRVKQLLQPRDKRPKDKALTSRYDAAGKVMLPGLVDGAIDMDAYMSFALGLDLFGANTRADVLARLNIFAADNGERHWLVGRGWDGQASALDAAALDTLVADRPVILFDRGERRAVANNRALSLLGQSGDGRLEGEALANAIRAMPALRAADRDRAFQDAQLMLLSSGITALSDIGTTISDWQVYRRAGDEGRLRVRISAYAEGTNAMELIAGPRPTVWLYQNRLRLTGVYLPLDGARETGRIWLAGAPQPPGGNMALYQDSELRNSMVRGVMDGFSVALGAHGDGALEEADAAIEELAETYPGEGRWRVVGADVSTPLAQAPGYGLTVRAGTDSYGRPARTAEASFAPIDPVASYGAELRTDALAARTLWPARAAGMGEFTGSLAPGKWADFILLDADLTRPDSFSGEVSETWIAGVPVWRSAEAQRLLDAKER